MLRVMSIEMHRENLKEGSIRVCWIDVSTIFQISGTKFP